jgi:poly-gamma-glutamate synthase PgsB/CapB
LYHFFNLTLPPGALSLFISVPFTEWQTTLFLLDVILISSIALLILLGLMEKARLNHYRSRIPIRIHVNGTRGKSSVTRLIAAGLRQGGIKTIAKVTGTYPRIILENGSEVPVKRRGRPNIKEQIGVICMAGKRQAQALVLECNAVQPEFQWVSEHRIFRSTLGVMTNVRRGHTDAMGESPEEIARCLSNTIPPEACLVIPDTKTLRLFERKASALKTKMILSEGEVFGIKTEWHGPLPFPENVALALKVCEECGVDRQTALQGMMRALSDPGALEVIDFTFEGRVIRFVNAFSANDPESVEHILRLLAEKQILPSRVCAMVNNRRDRVSRALEFVRFVARREEFERVFFVGDLGRLAHRMALSYGADERKVSWLRTKRTDELIHQICRSVSDDPLFLIGTGNFGGLGERIVSYLREIKK